MTRKREEHDTVQVPAVKESAVAIADADELECPTNSNHQRIRLYNIHRNTGYAVCDDCGRTWEVAVTFEVDLKLYLSRVAEGLRNAPTHPSDTGPVVVMNQNDALEMADTLQRLVRDEPETLTSDELRRYYFIGRSQRIPSRPAAKALPFSLASAVLSGLG